MINLENMYAVIPDIHGDFAHLETTVLGLGFKKSCSDASWRHPKGRKAVFLGNFIDGGKDNEQVIETVRAMVEAGAAQAIMGNTNSMRCCFMKGIQLRVGTSEPTIIKTLNNTKAFWMSSVC